MTLKKTITFACVAILIANLLLVLLSWIISAMGVAGVRSLISSEGLRWFLSRYVDIIATPLLAWLLLLSIAYSCFEGSGLSLALCRAMKGEKLEFKQRLGIRVALIVLVVIIANTLLLLLTPHAVLLSPSGDIFPSPFSRSIVPIVPPSRHFIVSYRLCCRYSFYISLPRSCTLASALCSDYFIL